MNFLKRALLSVTRKKGKTIILFVIFFAISNLVLAGFAIQHATQKASEKVKEDFQNNLTQLVDTDKLKLVLSFNSEKAMQQQLKDAQSSNSGPVRINIKVDPITESMANKIVKLDHISTYNYIVNGGGMADGFTPVTVTENADSTDSSDNSTTSSDQGRFNGWGGKGGIAIGGSNFTFPDVSITGVLSSELDDNFISGNYTLVSGRHIDPKKDAGKKVALIEKTLADQNDLKVNSKIKIKPVSTDSSSTTTSTEYTVIGIYKSAESTSSTSNNRGRGGLDFMQPSNNIFMDYKSSKSLKYSMKMGATATSGIDQAVYYADDIANIDSIKAAAKKLNIDWDKFNLTATYDQYKAEYDQYKQQSDENLKQATKSVDNVSSISTIMVFAAGIIGAIILALILMLSVKERMYETGVLLSMGEGKLKVISQILVEVIIVAIIAFGVSIFSGNVIDQKIGDKILNDQLQQTQTVAQQDNSNNRGPMGGGAFTRVYQRNSISLPKIETAKNIDIKITSNEVAKTAGAGFLVILLAILIPASNIMRFKPKTILTKAT